MSPLSHFLYVDHLSIFSNFFFVSEKTKELLHTLLWITQFVMRPTLRHSLESYETWLYRNGLHPTTQTRRLHQKKLLVTKKIAGDNRVFRLTEKGRLLALGGRDPEEEWSRPWDGKWRLALFDIPVNEKNVRDKLRRYLRQRRFGFRRTIKVS